MLTARFPQVKTQHWVLAGILAVALLLRVWGIGFGLPFVYHYDEHFYINTALNLGAGVLNNPPYAPTGLSNIYFAEYAGYYVLGKALGIFTSPQAFEMAYRTDPTAFYILGRLTTALLGTITVWAVFIAGKNTFGTKTGLLAAGFLATSFLHVRDSHYAVPDIAMSCFVVLAVGLAAVSLRTGKRRYIYASAVIGGFAVATKWTAFPVIASVCWASTIGGDQRLKGVVKRLLTPEVLLVGTLFILGFSMGSPQILLRPEPYLSEALGQYGAGKAGGFEIWQVDTVSGWVFYVKTLLHGVGGVMLGLAIVGVLNRLASPAGKSTAMVLVLSFPVLYYALMGSTQHYFARYALPLVPFVALFAAEGVGSIFSWVSKRKRLSLALLTAMGVVAVIQPIAQSVKSGVLLTREDTRTTAKRWIEANIPDGARIAVDWPVHTPPLSTAESRVPGSERTYYVYEVGGEGLSAHSAVWYQEQGFDYLITSSFIHSIPLVHRERDLLRRDFYLALANKLVLAKEFRPYDGEAELPFIFDEIYGPAVSLWHRTQPGPIIKVYAMPSSAETRH